MSLAHRVIRPALPCIALLVASIAPAYAGAKYECAGKTITAEGPLMSKVTEASGEQIETHARIDGSNLLVTIAKYKPDGALDRVFRFTAAIGDLVFDARSTQLGIRKVKKGGANFTGLVFYAKGNAKSISRDEVFCRSGQSGVYKTNFLDPVFEKEDEARAFFAKVQALQSTLPAAGGAGEAAAAPASRIPAGANSCSCPKLSCRSGSISACQITCQKGPAKCRCTQCITESGSAGTINTCHCG